MLSRLITKFTIFVLNHKRLSETNKALLTSALLNNLMAIPLTEIITFDTNGTVNIEGKTLSLEQARAFTDSARALKDSIARRIIRDQLTFEAIKMGVHKGMTPDMILFSKAALWVMEEEERLLSTVLDG